MEKTGGNTVVTYLCVIVKTLSTVLYGICNAEQKCLKTLLKLKFAVLKIPAWFLLILNCSNTPSFLSSATQFFRLCSTELGWHISPSFRWWHRKTGLLCKGQSCIQSQACGQYTKYGNGWISFKNIWGGDFPASALQTLSAALGPATLASLQALVPALKPALVQPSWVT